VVDAVGSATLHVASGRIVNRTGGLGDRLRAIFEGLGTVIAEHAPEELAVEDVFVARNPASALRLGQAQGAALLAGVLGGVPLFEYPPAQVKQAVAGHGRADKDQVAHMVRLILRLPDLPGEDVTDALAVALCHAHTRTSLARVPLARRHRRGRMR
jgi:crossover junction endodeoxyribonuclease RuvC